MGPKVIRQAARPFKALFVSDAFAGVLLITVAFAAVAIANSSAAPSYHALLHHTLQSTPIAALPTLHAWINDGLMAIFFFVVGLEVKRELAKGALADPAARRLPVISAVAGMVCPALVYLAIAGSDPALVRGWAIPAATDIAFAMGVVGLLGARVSPALRTFLLTVAIVDDIGAVAIIAMFYSTGLSPIWLVVSVGLVVALVMLNRFGVTTWLPYVVGTVLLWFCVLHSGIHATVAGVVAALTVPVRADNSTAEALEHRLVGWNAYLIVPLFGFANAGVGLPSLGAAFSALPLAIGTGLVIGKQAGIFGAVALAERWGFARRPDGSSWREVWGVALLCGIGFTMSLFITGLAFSVAPDLAEEAKVGILAGSLLSALLGYVILRGAKQANPS